MEAIVRLPADRVSTSCCCRRPQRHEGASLFRTPRPLRLNASTRQSTAASAEAPRAPVAGRPKRVSELEPEARWQDGGSSAPPDVHSGELLSKYSTWEIGGPARHLTTVRSTPEMARALKWASDRGLRHLVLGKGSNCLFDDRGFDGLVILNHIEFLEDAGGGVFRCGTGVAFNALGLHLSRRGYTGLEFASGIPGTVGGALFMNAGADGQETYPVVESVEAVARTGATTAYARSRGELPYSYRHSRFQDPGFVAEHALTSATFRLVPDEGARARAEDLLTKRKRSQPLSAPSAGCVFRNPGEGAPSAGALIDKAGLKGFAVGSAVVSAVHANFLVNAAGAGGKAADILALIAAVKARVRDATGMELHEEVMYIPYEAAEKDRGSN